MCKTFGRIVFLFILTFNNIALAVNDVTVQIDTNFAPLTESEVKSIAVDAYIYAYPLVLMEISKRIMTNYAQPDPDGKGAPINQFSHKKTFPDATFTDVVSPNADTLYSILWYDVTEEPLIIEVPASNGRYFLLPALDMWTDVFMSPGSRTTGNNKQTYALASANWKGNLPPNVSLIYSPTNVGWMIGRYSAKGKEDFPNVWELQKQLTATPLSIYGTDKPLPTSIIDPNIDKTAPVQQIEKLTAEQYFQMFCAISANNKPHANDYPILAQMRRIGIIPGQLFKTSDPRIAEAINEAPRKAKERISMALQNMGKIVNGWHVNLLSVGTYGTDYLQRATIAYKGLGANVVQDAIYPMATADSSNKVFNSKNKYMVHFDKNQLPPVNGFWSLTVYNEQQFFADNPINRYAIGDRDHLKFNKDGSLDIYLQQQSPGAEKESNWLPLPTSGSFSLALRLYWPKETVLDQSWSPPPVKLMKR